MIVDPIISFSLELTDNADADKLADSLTRLVEADLTLSVTINQEGDQTIIAGMSEHQLDTIIHRLLHEFNIPVIAGKPQIEYRTTVRKKAKSEGKFIRRSGGRGQYGHVILELEPTVRGTGAKFENRIVGEGIPQEYIPHVEAGIKAALEASVSRRGSLCPVIDVKTTLIFGSYHEIDSSGFAFRNAGQLAVQEGLVKAEPVLLEPIMKLQVQVPPGSLSDVFEDIRFRRGKIEDLEESLSRLRAIAPLSNLLGYEAYINDTTEGHGKVVMEFIGYEEVPPAQP